MMEYQIYSINGIILIETVMDDFYNYEPFDVIIELRRKRNLNIDVIASVNKSPKCEYLLWSEK